MGHSKTEEYSVEGLFSELWAGSQEVTRAGTAQDQQEQEACPPLGQRGRARASTARAVAVREGQKERQMWQNSLLLDNGLVGMEPGRSAI
jgi:hypothetical protein